MNTSLHLQRWLMMLLLAFASAVTAMAQIVLSGTVSEMFGRQKEPCPGVNITVVNANNRTLTGTISDMSGRYSLHINARPTEKLTLVFSFIGMKTQRVAYIGQEILDIVMREDNRMLDDIVVETSRQQHTEMGVTAKYFTGASQSIKLETVLETSPVTSIEEALQGQLGGVDILASGDPGAKGSIRIRGTATLESGSDPLIVINGVPYNTDISDDFDFSTANTEDYADMLSLNPNDIESIEVLKDAASTAIYGTKGANGVLLITTKQGQRGKPRISFTTKTTVKYEPKHIPMLSGPEYTAYMQDAIWNTANARGLSSSSDLLDRLFDVKSYAIGYQPSWSYFDEYNQDYDWLGAIVKDAVTTDNNISLSGGGERATYRFSVGYTSESGTTRGTDMRRLTSALRLTYNFTKRLNVMAEFTYSDTKNDASYMNSSSLRTEAMRKMPNKSPYYINNETGQMTDVYFTYQDANEWQGAFTGSKNYHPIAMVDMSYNNTSAREEKITISPQMKLLVDADDVAWLTWSAYVAMKYKTTNTRAFLPQEATGVSIESTYANLSSTAYANNLTLQTENKLLLRREWKERRHQLVMALLWKTSQSTGSSYSSKVYGVASAGISDPTMGGTIYSGSLGSGDSESRSLNGIGNFNYTFDQWLTFNGTLNYEGNTALGSANRWGLFKSWGVALNLTDFYGIRSKESLRWITQAKLRYSWGQSGKSPSGTAPYVGTYSAVGQNYGTMTPVEPSTLQLDHLKWETTTENDLGVDLGLWHGRLKMSYDLYHKHTVDLLTRNLSISTTTGFSALAYVNSGAMSNIGWEFRIDCDVIKTQDWKMSLNFNINRNENHIDELPSNMSLSSYTFGNGQYAVKYQIGAPVGSFFGYRYQGVYQNTDDTYARDAEGRVMHDLGGRPVVMQNGNMQCYPGDARYEDVNHDGRIDQNDIVYLGNCNPMVTGGSGANVRWRDLTLTLFFHYRMGQKIINQARMNAEAMYNEDNQSTAVLRRWRNEGDQTDIPRALYNYGYNYLGSDRFVEDCSYVRLKTLSLSYKLPTRLTRPIGLSGVSCFLTGYDLITFTGYRGQDPEVTLPGVGSLAVDGSSTPRSRRFAAGLTINF